MSDLTKEEMYKIQLKEINEKLLINLQNYRKTLTYMYADAPIEALCLPNSLQNILIDSGCLRIYDLIDRDLTEIKGLGKTRINRLTTCLNEFLSMC